VWKLPTWLDVIQEIAQLGAVNCTQKLASIGEERLEKPVRSRLRNTVPTSPAMCVGRKALQIHGE
jgi:hypothetical protein